MHGYTSESLDPARKRSRALLLAGGVVLGALSLATVTAAQLYLNWRLYGEARPYGAIWLSEATEWLLWAGAIPAVIALDRRYGFAAGRPRTAIPAHLLQFLLVYAAINAVMSRLAYRIPDPTAAQRAYWDHFVLRAVNHAPSAVLVYGAILGVWLITRAAEARARRTARLETRLAEERLRFLRAQIQPHFLFNALHSIGGLVREGRTTEAVDAISGLGHLLRQALSSTEEGIVTLSDELEFVRSYFEIQRLRFGDRVILETRIEPGTESASVPSMLLQPLVENAIRHGLDPRGGHGRIEVESRQVGENLVITVTDDGVGCPTFPPSRDRRGARRDGIGLENLRQRLVSQFGDGTGVTTDSTSDEGMTVRVVLPLRRRMAEVGA